MLQKKATKQHKETTYFGSTSYLPEFFCKNMVNIQANPANIRNHIIVLRLPDLEGEEFQHEGEKKVLHYILTLSEKYQLKYTATLITVIHLFYHSKCFRSYTSPSSVHQGPLTNASYFTNKDTRIHTHTHIYIYICTFLATGFVALRRTHLLQQELMLFFVFSVVSEAMGSVTKRASRSTHSNIKVI